MMVYRTVFWAIYCGEGCVESTVFEQVSYVGSSGGLWAAFFLRADMSERAGCVGDGDDGCGGGCCEYWRCFECPRVVQASGGEVGDECAHQMTPKAYCAMAGDITLGGYFCPVYRCSEPI